MQIQNYNNLLNSTNNSKFNSEFRIITDTEFNDVILNLNRFSNIEISDKFYFDDNNIIQINKGGIFTSLYRYWIGTGREKSIKQLEKFISKINTFFSIIKILFKIYNSEFSLVKIRLLQTKVKNIISNLENLKTTYKDDIGISEQITNIIIEVKNIESYKIEIKKKSDDIELVNTKESDDSKN